MTKLTAASVRNAGPGRHHDGKGLYLYVQPGGARSWVLRIQSDGKRRDIGLGAADLSPRSVGKGEESPIAIPLLQRKLLTLSEAREKGRMLRDAAKAGLDPIFERDRERRSIPRFRDAAKEAHAAWKDGRKEKDAQTFIRSLEIHAFPVLGDMRVDAITAGDIGTVLAPIWTSKPDMGRKVRQRIGRVLNFAHAKGWRPTEAPVKSVSASLPRQPKGGNYKAMPYTDVPKLVAVLNGQAQTFGRRVTLFQLLTAARPGEARAARWEHIDLEAREWRIPAAMMKAGLPHTVTLNEPAVALLEAIKAERTVRSADLVFPGRGGGMLSDMTMNKMLRDAGFRYDAHGFRSSFRDWAAEMMPEIPDPVAEAALAHAVPDKVERAYKRTNFIEMRRKLLDAWGEFVVGVGGLEARD
jgi:integrase